MALAVEDRKYLEELLYNKICYEFTWAKKDKHDKEKVVKSADYLAGIWCPNCKEWHSAKYFYQKVGEVFGIGCKVCEMKVCRIYLTEDRLFTSSVFLPRVYNIEKSCCRIFNIDFWSVSSMPRGPDRIRVIRYDQ